MVKSEKYYENTERLLIKNTQFMPELKLSRNNIYLNFNNNYEYFLKKFSYDPC
jgi:hypothetical protein